MCFVFNCVGVVMRTINIILEKKTKLYKIELYLKERNKVKIINRNRALGNKLILKLTLWYRRFLKICVPYKE